MRTYRARMLGPTLCALALIGAAGCQKQEVEKTVEDAGKTIERGAEKAVPAVEKGMATAVPAVEKAGKAVAKTAVEMAMTGKVKTALIANKTISASEINVDTVGKVVYLRGTVPSAAQKNLAGVIAKKEAGNGYAVKNELKIAGAQPAAKKK